MYLLVDVYVKQLSGVGKVSVKRTYPTPDSCLTHIFSRSRAVVAYNTVLVWSRLNAPVELSTRYTTPDTTVEIGSTSATVE